MRRLKKSLACDWMRPETVKQFPLRQFYVQLQWQRKIQQALRTDTVTLDSIHKLIEQMTACPKGTNIGKSPDTKRRKYTDGNQQQGTSESPRSINVSSVIIEGI